jgi:polyribonucleotide nucleotidyltransferase
MFGGRELTIETGRMARQANGSVLVTYGETVVLVTACASKSAREGIDFFPLVCDYIEKTYAAGKIPGGYLKREGRLSTDETLTSRLMDRPIRPLFPETFRCETQVMATVVSADKENDPAINAMIGAGAALHISDIPFAGPTAGVRVGRVDGKFIANPTFEEQDESDLDMLIVVGPEGILMVEGEADFVPEQVVVDALQFAKEATAPVMKLVDDLRKKVGKEKRPVADKVIDADLQKEVLALVDGKLEKAITTKEKLDRYAALDELWAETKKALAEKLGADFTDAKARMAKEYYGNAKANFMRTKIIKEGIRIDGRDTTTIRPLSLETSVLPRTHGSALFTRGETQALATCTLGTSHDEQRVDSLTGDWRKSFMLHYNFPAFSVGEVKMLRGPGRREIGHGTLAERGVEKILPVSENFPYTIRIVSEVLESNGSSSMATVCGASMALMDAGVPVSSSVAGIAMGLIKEGDETAILTDILGDEDHMGDMDFKVIGNKDGISAVQMDIKIDGLQMELMADALEQARAARLNLLEQMDACISGPNTQLSVHAPRIFTILISPDRIRDLIGPGGKHIKGIVEQTGVTVDVDDAGKVSVAAIDEQAAAEAIQLIKGYTEEPEVGRVYLGQVVKVVDFGAFVRILPGAEGLLHISELADERVENVKDIVDEGDEVLVKVLNIDRGGKIRLSRKAALAQAEAPAVAEA